MLYIVWNKENELGISIIDEQHRGIVSTINSFHYFIRKGHGAEALAPTFNVLSQYTKLHFETEEELMAAAHYPVFDAHVTLHKELTKKTVNAARDAISQEDASVLLALLRDWWLGHINHEDRKYAPYVIKDLVSRGQT